MPIDKSRIFLSMLYEHEKKGIRLRTTYAAKKLGISKPAITDMSRLLKSEGYINYEPYKPYELTSSGKLLAKEINTKLLVLEKYIFTHFHITPYRSKIEAMHIEPAISDYLFEQIKIKTPVNHISLFGDIVGDNIDTHTKPLSRCDEGTSATAVAISAIETDINDSFWIEISNYIGKNIIIVKKSNTTESMNVFIKHANKNIPNKIAEKILVTEPIIADQI